MSVPKGLWPAVTEVEQAAGLRLRLYEHYDRDADLREALLALHQEWWPELGPFLRRLDDCLPDDPGVVQLLVEQVGDRYACGYLQALLALAAGAGLVRIPRVGEPPVVLAGYLPSGVAQAHRYLWHLDKALLREVADIPAARSLPAVPRPTFVALASFGVGVPLVDTDIAGTGARWDPRTEVRAEARRRLPGEAGLPREAVERELGRIAQEGRYRFPDTSTRRGGIWRLDRDAEWVWWRIRKGWTYERIVREWRRLHPADLRLQRRKLDDEARQWEAENPEEAGALMNPAEAVYLVRKAVATFADRARVDVRTGPGRLPAGQSW